MDNDIFKHIIVGTAGHIDHGKTALIQSLTGINTDRLQEEQQRGISIVLGFAELVMPSGVQVGIIDVPGHEKFVRNMLAGVAGIDFVLFVIAADEGVMPQTVEHLEILQLLGVKRGIVVLSKIDLVDEEWLALVEEDLKPFIAGTFLENAPIVHFSAATKVGLDALLQNMERLAKETKARSADGIPRLPVDRVFSVQGIGTVVTGTLWSGKIQAGAMVEIQPSNIRCKIRNIQVHDRDTKEAVAGQRTALALQGVDKDQINRGDVVTVVDRLQPTYMIDVRLTAVRSLDKNIKNRQKVHFHQGTSTTLGNVILLEQDELGPGENTLAQIRLENPIVAARGDRFVIRFYSPIITIGGGEILDVHPPKHKRFQPDVNETLIAIEAEAYTEAVEMIADKMWFHCVSLKEMAERLTLDPADLKGRLTDAGLVIDRANWIIRTRWFEALKTDFLAHLQKYHRKNPLRTGAPPLEIRNALPSELPESMFQAVLETLRENNEIIENQQLISLPDFSVSLSDADRAICDKVVDLYTKEGLTPPALDQLPAEMRPDIIHYLVNTGELVRINRTLLFAKTVMDKVYHDLDAYFEQNEGITVGDFRDQLGVSRKYAIPVLEYLDQQGYTRREGDLRYKNR